MQTDREAVSEEISGQTGGKGRTLRHIERAKTARLQVIRSALGRTRTCDLLIRSLGKLVSGGSSLLVEGGAIPHR